MRKALFFSRKMRICVSRTEVLMRKSEGCVEQKEANLAQNYPFYLKQIVQINIKL